MGAAHVYTRILSQKKTDFCFLVLFNPRSSNFTNWGMGESMATLKIGATTDGPPIVFTMGM